MIEENVYDKLRKCLRNNNVKNTVVINGWKDEGSGNLAKNDPLYRAQKEFDFLIVSQPSQTIIHIEVKRTCTQNDFDKAKQQLENGLKMFQETIPFPEEVNWKYIRVVYFAFAQRGGKVNRNKKKPNSSDPPTGDKPFENKCLKCKNFIIGPKTDLNLWWNELINCVPQETTAKLQIQPNDTYLNIVRFLLHQMYKQQDCATTGQLVQLTTQTSDKICSPNTIMFWSKEQYKTFKDFKDKKVALTSGFGTGKTVLIRAKAKELSAAGEKVVIVIFEITAEKIILRMEYEKIFSTENLLVTITGISGAKGNQIYCFNVES
jgi:hypothetical protein